MYVLNVLSASQMYIQAMLLQLMMVSITKSSYQIIQIIMSNDYMCTNDGGWCGIKCDSEQIKFNEKM